MDENPKYYYRVFVVVGGFCRTKADGNSNYYYCKGDGIQEGVIEIIIITRSIRNDETNRFKNEAPPPLLDTATVTYTIVDYSLRFDKKKKCPH